jgi:phenylalanyl-tRNA synthetase alpha chain
VSSPVSYLNPVQLQRDLGIRDLSEPAEGPHAIQILIDRAVARLRRAWGCEVRWCRGPRIVPVADNYDRLGYAVAAITRDARYTRYVDATSMLRSHSTAMIPPALRRLASESGDDVLLVCPGIVYRRDAIDWQHTGTPHQLDLWLITRRAVSGADLDQMITVLLGALVPGSRHRQLARTHPYTLHGRQVDVRQDGRWVEVWECGQAHPGVLAAAGLPGRSGLALGMAWTGCSCWPSASPTSACSAPPIPGSLARCSTSPPTNRSRRCRPSPGTCPAPSPPTTTRKL